MRAESFHTPGDVLVRLRIPAGRVDVETVDGEETRVELASEPGIEESATIDARRGEVVVEVEERRLAFIRTTPEVRVRVTCPPGVRLAFKGVTTDLAVRGRSGSAEATTVSGDVELGRVDGELEVRTTSGDVTVDAVAGRAAIRTVSGDIRVDEAGGPVTGQTVSGDQRYGSVAEGAVTLKTVSGDLLVGIRRGTRLWVDAKSMSGDTSSELAVGDTPEDGEGPLVELRATALSGDIRIVRT